MVQQFVDPVVVVRETEVAGLVAQDFAHGEERVEHQLLRHHAQPRAGGAIVAADVVAHDGDAATARAREAGEHRDQRGLAGAIGAQQGEELALFDVEADIVDGGERTIVLAHPFDMYGRQAHAAISSSNSPTPYNAARLCSCGGTLRTPIV